jgi:hypothetical protein
MPIIRAAEGEGVCHERMDNIEVEILKLKLLK